MKSRTESCFGVAASTRCVDAGALTSPTTFIHIHLLGATWLPHLPQSHGVCHGGVDAPLPVCSDITLSPLVGWKKLALSSTCRGSVRRWCSFFFLYIFVAKKGVGQNIAMMNNSFLNMASIGDFDPLNASIPATKVEITVSCR